MSSCNHKYIVLLIIALVCVSTLASAAEFDNAGIDLSQAQKEYLLLPTSGEVLASFKGKIEAQQLAGHIGGSALGTHYGFSSGISEEKGSFRLGVLLTDVSVSLAANDKNKALQAVKALLAGLVALAAPDELLQSVINLNASLVSSKEVSTLTGVVIPLIRPFMEAFVKKEGKLAFLQLGEWCQTLRLTAASANPRNLGVISSLLAQSAAAGYFSQTFSANPAVPEGVKKALRTLAGFQQKPIDNLKAVAEIKQQVDNIILLN